MTKPPLDGRWLSERRAEWDSFLEEARYSSEDIDHGRALIWADAGLQLLDEVERLRKVEDAAQKVADALPNYTATGGTIWKADRLMDGLRQTLKAEETK